MCETTSSRSRHWLWIRDRSQTYKAGIFFCRRSRWGMRGQSQSSIGRSGTPATASVRPQLREAAARQNRVHVRAAGGSREQVSRNALFIRVWKTEPRAVFEPHRNASQDLVPEPKNQVEKAEPGCWGFTATRDKLSAHHQPNLWIHICAPPSVQHRERYLSFGCTADVLRCPLASVFPR